MLMFVIKGNLCFLPLTVRLDYTTLLIRLKMVLLRLRASLVH